MMNLKSVTILVLLMFLFHSATAQNAVSIELKTDIQNVQTADAYVDHSFLRLRPLKYTSNVRAGECNFQIPLERNMIVELIIANLRIPVYVQPGDKLVIQLSNPNNPSLQLSGTSASENEFLQKFFGIYAAMFDDSLNQSKMIGTGIDQFESDLFKLRKEQEAFLSASEVYSALRPEFKTFLENQIRYHYWSSLLNYPVTRANSSTTIMTVEPLPEIMLQGLESIKLNDEEALLADTYRNFLKYHNVYFTSQANKFKKFTDYSVSAEKKMAMARDKFTGPIYTYWLAKFTTEECGRLAPFLVKKMQSELKELDLRGVYAPIVKEYCESLPVAAAGQGESGKSGQASKAGNSDELDLTDVDGKPVKLKDFKGKVVYIDFWATWCGPCRVMFPFSKKLAEQLTEKEKKQIVFLYISIDANKEAWLKGIKDLDIQGVNVISPGNWKSKACSYFQINGIPRYMIMNKKGEIVDANAKRPADPSVLDDLRKYLAD